MANPEQYTPERDDHQRTAERYVGAPRGPESEQHTNHQEQTRNAEKARTEASHEAIASKEYASTHRETEKRAPIVSPTKTGLKQSFDATMSRTRNNMSPQARVFSKIIHSPVVERSSELLGSTVARPDAILSGSIFAFVATLVIYVIARYAGFQMTGSISIATFIVGWLIGILFDVLRGIFRKRR